MLSYDLWYEDEQTCDDGYDGGDKHRARSEVFDEFYFGMPLPGDDIGQSFHAGVDDLCNPDQSGHHGQDRGFGIGYMQEEAGDDHCQSRRHVDAGIVLAADELPQARQGMGEAFDPASDGEFFRLHVRGLVF
jgi:hypothetical protein